MYNNVIVHPVAFHITCLYGKVDDWKWPQHSLLNVHKISHTGHTLAEKNRKNTEIDSLQILMAVTDNGCNMIKGINTIKFSRQVSVTVSGDSGENW